MTIRRKLALTLAAFGSIAWVCNTASLPGFKAVGTLGDDRPPTKYLPGMCR